MLKWNFIILFYIKLSQIQEIWEVCYLCKLYSYICLSGKRDAAWESLAGRRSGHEAPCSSICSPAPAAWLQPLRRVVPNAVQASLLIWLPPDPALFPLTLKLCHYVTVSKSVEVLPILSNQRVDLCMTEKGQSSLGCLVAEMLIFLGVKWIWDQEAVHGSTVTGRVGLF